MLRDLSPPPVEPITLAETKLFLRVDQDDDDALIETLITSARETLEARLGVAMISRPMETSGPAARVIRVPRYPVVSVDSVSLDGSEITEFDADLRRQPSTVTINLSGVRDAGVDIAFTAGFGDEASDIPTPLLQAMLLLVAHAYEHRDDPETRPIPFMVDALTQPYRMASL